MKSKKNSTFKLKNYFVASLALHFLFILTTSLLSTLKKDPVAQNVEVVLLEQPEVVAAEPPQPDISQIVETDSNFANNQLSEKAKFHSEKSNTVEKETRAKTGEQFKNALRKGTKTVQTQKAQQKAKASELLNPSFDPYAALTKKTLAQDEKKFAAAQTGTQVGETSTTNDNLSVQEDLITKLNTKEYKYYGYYHRIKVQLNQWWQPKVREKVTKMVNQGRTIASEENKTTRLIIILNNAGSLVKVQVLAESGVRDLDDAAVEAFRSAAPFPNPPKGIIESDGTVKIRWDFVVES
jgi:TonB family protein